jgi:hypothetical protein
MKLRFYAREDALAYVPGIGKQTGQAPRYIGRTLELKPHLVTYPATVDAHEANVDPSSPEQSQQLARYCKLVRNGAIWAADKATADAIGVAFVPVTFRDGAWIRDADKPKR